MGVAFLDKRDIDEIVRPAKEGKSIAEMINGFSLLSFLFEEV